MNFDINLLIIDALDLLFCYTKFLIIPAFYQKYYLLSVSNKFLYLLVLLILLIPYSMTWTNFRFSPYFTTNSQPIFEEGLN